MKIETRELAFKVASKSCEVLAVDVTAEKLWSLVEAIAPILEGGLTPLAPDDAYASCPFRAFVNYPSLGDVVECEYRIAGKA